MVGKRSTFWILAGAVILISGVVVSSKSRFEPVQLDASSVATPRHVNDANKPDASEDSIVLARDGSNDSINEPVKDNATAQSYDQLNDTEIALYGSEKSVLDLEVKNQVQDSAIESDQLIQDGHDKVASPGKEFVMDANDFRREPHDTQAVLDAASFQENSQANFESAPTFSRSTQWISDQNAAKATSRLSATQTTSSLRNQVLPSRFAVSETVAHKAIHHIEYGKSLSRRGAAFAAKQEFFHALSLIAQAIDSQDTKNNYSKSLNNALVAVRETEDLFVGSSESQIGLDVARVVESHQSKIIAADVAGTMTPVQVIQRYFAFAENQLSIAGGQNVVAAEALYCLGKLHSVISKHDPNPDRLDVAKAIMFHRAALQCDSKNYRSANELGALYAKSGHMNESKAMLTRSLIIRQTPQAWANLAIIHQRLGESHLAELAKTEFEIKAGNRMPNGIPNTIQWVSPQKFNDGAQLDYHEATTRVSKLPAMVAPKVESDERAPKLIDKIKSWF